MARTSEFDEWQMRQGVGQVIHEIDAIRADLKPRLRGRSRVGAAMALILMAADLVSQEGGSEADFMRLARSMGQAVRWSGHRHRRDRRR